jgi:hypothetical protein
MKMMLLIAFDFYFYTFLLQSFFEDHQVTNFQPLSTESSYAINLNITRLLCRYKVKLSVLKVKNQSVIFTFSELENKTTIHAIGGFWAVFQLLVTSHWA